jgi:ribosomal protein L2
MKPYLALVKYPSGSLAYMYTTDQIKIGQLVYSQIFYLFNERAKKVGNLLNLLYFKQGDFLFNIYSINFKKIK